MNTDLSAKATNLACTGVVARVVFLWNPAEPDQMGSAGLSVDADGLSPKQMMELSTSLAAFSRSIAHAVAERTGTKPELAWQFALHMMDAPDHETRTRTSTVKSVAGGGT